MHQYIDGYLYRHQYTNINLCILILTCTYLYADSCHK